MCRETQRWDGGGSVANDVMENLVGYGKDSVLYSAGGRKPSLVSRDTVSPKLTAKDRKMKGG